MIMGAAVLIVVNNQDRLEAEFMFLGITVTLVLSEAVRFLDSKSQTKS